MEVEEGGDDLTEAESSEVNANVLLMARRRRRLQQMRKRKRLKLLLLKARLLRQKLLVPEEDKGEDEEVSNQDSAASVAGGGGGLRRRGGGYVIIRHKKQQTIGESLFGIDTELCMDLIFAGLVAFAAVSFVLLYLAITMVGRRRRRKKRGDENISKDILWIGRLSDFFNTLGVFKFRAWQLIGPLDPNCNTAHQHLFPSSTHVINPSNYVVELHTTH